MLMAWVEEDEVMTLSCESPRQGQEELEDAAGPPGELLAGPLQKQERQEEEDL